MLLYKHKINLNPFTKMHQKYVKDSIVWLKYITHQNYYQSNKTVAKLFEYRPHNVGSTTYRLDHFVKIRRRLVIPELINAKFNKQLSHKFYNDQLCLRSECLYKSFIIVRSSGYSFYVKGLNEKIKDCIGIKKKRYQIPYGKMYKFDSTRNCQPFTMHIV